MVSISLRVCYIRLCQFVIFLNVQFLLFRRTKYSSL